MAAQHLIPIPVDLHRGSGVRSGPASVRQGAARRPDLGEALHPPRCYLFDDPSIEPASRRKFLAERRRPVAL